AKAVVTEPLVLHKDLVDHLLRRPHVVSPFGRGASVELCTGRRRPAALCTNAAHGGAMRGEGYVASGLAILSNEAMAGDAEFERGNRMAGLNARLAIELGQWLELARPAADYGDHQREPIIGRAGHRIRRAADGDPEGQRVLHRL